MSAKPLVSKPLFVDTLREVAEQKNEDLRRELEALMHEDSVVVTMFKELLLQEAEFSHRDTGVYLRDNDKGYYWRSTRSRRSSVFVLRSTLADALVIEDYGTYIATRLARLLGCEVEWVEGPWPEFWVKWK